MHHHVKKHALPALYVAVAVVFFITTNPGSLPPVMLIVAFVCLFGGVYGVSRIIGGGLRELLRHETKPRRWVAVLLAAIVTLLLLLQSIGQLTIQDLLTLSGIAAILYFYMTKLTALPRGDQ